jgi:UDP-N-acetylglucosamine 2-epimerase (non-hydrolysing)
MRVLFIFGTRPEAIKLAPVILHLKRFPERYDVQVCVTAQHRGLLDQVLAVFGIVPDFDLNLMTPGQTLFASTSRIVAGLEPVFAEARPKVAVVQGDTTTAMCGALAAFYARVAVAHVEAGLRTGDYDHPFPEEMNRVLVSRIAKLHFAPTEEAAANLRREGISSGISVTGNTGIDAVLDVRDRLERGELQAPPMDLPAGRKLILVTAHRRESFGEGFERICQAIRCLADRGDVHVIYPVHPNPNVQDPVNRLLRSHPHVTLLNPVDYVPFVELMRKAYLILTDSGGRKKDRRWGSRSWCCARRPSVPRPWRLGR